MSRTPLLVLLALAAPSCTGSADPIGGATRVTAAGELVAPAEGEGFQLAFDAVAPPHKETWRCRIEKLGTGGTQHVRAVKHAQTAAVHHMTVAVLIQSGVQEPPGEYDCAPLYDKYPKLMDEIIVYGSQAADGEITLPPGVAASIPPGLTLMVEVHYVNTSDVEKRLTSRINLYTTPAENAKQGIWGGPVRDLDLEIPPHAEHTEWTRCVLKEDADVLFVSSHTHELGRGVEVLRWDGKGAAGEEIYRNADWSTPFIKSFGAPLHFRKGEGVEFRCHYQNPHDHTVRWGQSSVDEMCSIALVWTPGTMTNECTVVQSSDGKGLNGG